MGSELIEAIRPFWLPGLVAIPKITIQGFPSLINRQQYQVHNPIARSAASLYFSDLDEPVGALAYDLNRFASATFETLAAVSRNAELPKSAAWLCIKAYYGAYYAAHTLVRALGRTYSRVDSEAAISLNGIIDLFGMSNGIRLPAATYSGHLDSSSHVFAIGWAKNAQAGAAHAEFWRFFLVSCL